MAGNFLTAELAERGRRERGEIREHFFRVKIRKILILLELLAPEYSMTLANS